MQNEDPAFSVRKSQDWGNIHKPACAKVLKRDNGNNAPMAALTSLISGCDTIFILSLFLSTASFSGSGVFVVRDVRSSTSV
jgi:hypothetical protein